MIFDIYLRKMSYKCCKINKINRQETYKIEDINWSLVVPIANFGNKKIL